MSAATAYPYPSTYTFDPIGITVGSTAIVLIPLASLEVLFPDDVTPPPLYAVAEQVIDFFPDPSPLLAVSIVPVPWTTTWVVGSEIVFVLVTWRLDSTPSLYTTSYVTSFWPLFPLVLTSVFPAISLLSFSTTVSYAIVSISFFSCFSTLTTCIVKSPSTFESRFGDTSSNPSLKFIPLSFSKSDSDSKTSFIVSCDVLTCTSELPQTILIGTAFFSVIVLSSWTFSFNAGFMLSFSSTFIPCSFNTSWTVPLYVTNVCSLPSTFIVSVFLVNATVTEVMLNNATAVIKAITFVFGPLENLLRISSFKLTMTFPSLTTVSY